jgi:murein DD-endopeptidase MepM/ murein hydrolase activator NlpD
MQIDHIKLLQRIRNLLPVAIVLLPLTAHHAFAQLTEATPLITPVTSACISSPFGPRVLRDRPLAGTFHDGIDLPAAVGAPVWAIAPGTVIRVQKHGVGGLEMLVQHAGFIGVYSHLGLIAPAIAEGRRAIRAGERLATVGRSGLTYGSHLFFGMIVGGRPVDPAPYLGLKPCGSNNHPVADTPAHPASQFVQH